MVFEFFNKKYKFQRMRIFQLNDNYQNVVFIMVFYVHQLTLGSALQKQSPRGFTNSSSFQGTGRFGLDHLVLIRLSKFLKGFCSDHTDSGKCSVRTIQIITQNSPDPRSRYDQTTQTLGRSLIRLSRA